MTTVRIPYATEFMTAEIDDAELLGVYHSALPPAAADQTAEVERALDAPIGSEKLETLAAQAANAVIICSDHTRPVPSKILIPAMLARLRRGNPDIHVTLLIATGFHRATTREELVAKFGEPVVAAEKIAVHDSGDDSAMRHAGTLPSGGELILNKLALDADLLISEGFIEPHFFAGFSGGRKSVLPGVAARQTVLANHCAEFIASDRARTGILDGNPIHRDMLFAAKTARLAFILNVVIDGGKRIVRAFAGDCEAAHLAGAGFLSGCAGVAVPEADIAITGNGGHPLDQNVYQTVKGMTAGEAVTREGGVIIICSSCRDGHGGESFHAQLAAHTPEEILAQTARTPRGATIPDQWEYQILARILSRRKVIVVTTHCNHELLREMKLEAASSIEAALDLARRMIGQSKAKIAVIPDGVSVIAKKI